MTGLHYSVTYNLQGSPTSDVFSSSFKLPVAATLVYVSAVGSNANDSTISIGTSSDADGVLSLFSFGDSGTPAVAASWRL